MLSVTKMDVVREEEAEGLGVDSYHKTWEKEKLHIKQPKNVVLDEPVSRKLK